MASEMSKFNYDVFLSFRGPDTRQGFADVLHKGMVMASIRVFKDDRELEVGDRIDTILEAVNNSQLCVPIFSETFASSKWCLLEVAKMVHMKKTIVPIFYKVSSDDVKLKTEKYMKSMKEHETKYAKEEVEEWKGALKAAAQYMGRELSSKRYSEILATHLENLLFYIFKI